VETDGVAKAAHTKAHQINPAARARSTNAIERISKSARLLRRRGEADLPVRADARLTDSIVRKFITRWYRINVPRRGNEEQFRKQNSWR
jgi:hypothetical protein